MHEVTHARAPRVYLTGSGDLGGALAELVDLGADVALDESLDATDDDLSIEEYVAALKASVAEELAVISSADAVVAMGDLDAVTEGLAYALGKPVERY